MTTPTLLGSSVPTAFTDAEGNAYPNRTLAVSGPNGYSGSVTTEADGTFRLVNLPLGDYTVSDALTGINGTVPVLVRGQDAVLAASAVAVNYGTNAATPRPPGAQVVLWIGSATVTPTAMLAGVDVRVPTLTTTATLAAAAATPAQVTAAANAARDAAIAATTTPAQARSIAEGAAAAALATAATPAQVTAAASQARADAIAASEPRIPRGNAPSGSAVVLGTNGALTFGAAPGGSGASQPATTNSLGTVQLAGDLAGPGSTADAPRVAGLAEKVKGVGVDTLEVLTESAYAGRATKSGTTLYITI